MAPLTPDEFVEKWFWREISQHPTGMPSQRDDMAADLAGLLAHERERCAKVAEDIADKYLGPASNDTARKISRLIRESTTD